MAIRYLRTLAPASIARLSALANLIGAMKSSYRSLFYHPHPCLHEMTLCAWWRIGYISSLCYLLCSSCIALAPFQPLLDLQNQQTSHDRLGAVASENRVCSQIGIDLLKAGGNAADVVGTTSLSLRALLMGRIANRNYILCRRAWSAIQSEMHCGEAEDIQIVIIAE